MDTEAAARGCEYTADRDRDGTTAGYATAVMADARGGVEYPSAGFTPPTVMFAFENSSGAEYADRCEIDDGMLD